MHRWSGDAHSPPPPERTRRRPLSSGSRSPPQGTHTLVEEALPRDGHGDRTHRESIKRGSRPFPRTPLPVVTGVLSPEHGLAATRERHRGDGFVESALPPRVGSGVSAAPGAKAGAGEGAGAGNAVADSGMEAVEGSGVVVAAAGVTVDSSAEDPIGPLGPTDPLDPIDPLDPVDPLGPKRRPREHARGGEEELGETSFDGGAKTSEDHGWEIEKGLDGGGRGRDGDGGGSGVGAPLRDAGDDARTGGGLSGEEGAEEAPVDTEGGARTPPADKRAPRIGEERAHKMWVTMGGGATVLGKSGKSRRVPPGWKCWRRKLAAPFFK